VPPLYDSPEKPRTLREFDTYIRKLAFRLDRGRRSVPSKMFSFLVDRRPPDQVRLRGPHFGATMALSEEQSDLTVRLSELTCDIIRAWLLRGLNDLPPARRLRDGPPPPALLHKLSPQAWRLQTSIAAHAELIALKHILRPDQAERLRQRFWYQARLNCLWDPELTAQLKLSRAQRDALSDRLPRVTRSILEIGDETINARIRVQDLEKHGLIAKPEAEAREASAVRDSEQMIGRAENAIWELLTPSQARRLHRIIDRPAAKNPVAKTKAKDEGP
jgi:hypothetical protein